MRWALFSEVIRRIIWLAAGSPSTMARRPPRSALAAASLSRRNGIFLEAASAAWQFEHLSGGIGRTSRVDATSPSGAGGSSVNVRADARIGVGLCLLLDRQ